MRTLARVMLVLALGFATFFSAPVFADKFSCPEPKPRPDKDKRFYFDDLSFSLAKKDASKALKPIEAYEGRINFTGFGLESLFTAPIQVVAELFNVSSLCNWWSPNVALPFSFEQQGLLSQFAEGGTMFGGYADKLQLGVRWYMPKPFGDFEALALFEYRITHWSLHVGEPVQGRDIKTYIAQNDIEYSKLQQVDVLSLDWAHRFKLSPRIPFEYRVGYNVGQGSGSRFFYPDRNKPYPFRWFAEGRVAFNMTSRIVVAALFQSELSEKEWPRKWEFSLDKASQGDPHEIFQLFVRIPDGIPRDTIMATHWGVWTASPMSGIGWIFWL